MHPQPSLPIFFHFVSRFDKLQQLCFPLNCAIVSNPRSRVAMATPHKPRRTGYIFSQAKRPISASFSAQSSPCSVTRELRAFNGIKTWEIQTRLQERPTVQDAVGEHSFPPLPEAGPGHGQAMAPPGPKDMVRQLRRPRAALDGPGLRGTVRRSCLGHMGLHLRAADESVRSLRLRSIQATSW